MIDQRSGATRVKVAVCQLLGANRREKINRQVRDEQTEEFRIPGWFRGEQLDNEPRQLSLALQDRECNPLDARSCKTRTCVSRSLMRSLSFADGTDDGEMEEDVLFEATSSLFLAVGAVEDAPPPIISI